MFKKLKAKIRAWQYERRWKTIIHSLRYLAINQTVKGGEGRD